MKVYTDIRYKVEFDMADTGTDDDAYDVAIVRLRKCSPEDLNVDIEICRPEPEYYGEMM